MNLKAKWSLLMCVSAVVFGGGVASSAGKDEAVVRASSFGWDAEDSTASLQAALDSGADTVVVDRQAGPWITRPLFARSNQTIVFEDGVRLEAKRGEFKGMNDELLSVDGVTNVTIRGEGDVELRMPKADYQDRARYRQGEWRHSLSIVRSGNVRVSGLRIVGSGGDGVYVCQSENVYLRKIDSRAHHRQGISVISCRNLLVDDCVFRDTIGTAPEAGIDFEPNGNWDYLENCVVENCTFTGNRFAGILFHLLQLDSTSRPVSITVRNCRICGNKSYGISFSTQRTGRKPPRGCVTFERCEVSGNGSSALYIGQQAAGGVAFRMKDCTLDSRGVDRAAIVFNNDNIPEDVEDVSLEDIRVLTDGMPEVVFNGMAGTGVKSVKGVLTSVRKGVEGRFDLAALSETYRPDPELRKNFAAAPVDYQKLRAATPSARRTKPASVAFRGKFTYVVRFEGPGEYPVTFRTTQVGKRPIAATCQLRDAPGTDLGIVTLTAAVQTVVISAERAGVRRFEVDTRGNAIRVESDLPGQGVLTCDRVNLFRSRGRFHFRMPTGADTIRAEILPEEPASAALIAPDGTRVASMAKSTVSKVLSFRRPDAGKAETWAIEIDGDEDVQFRVGAPAIPLLAPEPDLVLE